MKTKKIISDICIIGAGPAGLTAGLFTSRRDLKTCMIAKDFGGQAVAAPIENYPGIERISGFDFAQKVWEQTKKYGCERYSDEIIAVQKDNDTFIVYTSQCREIHAKALILACGKTPRNLGIPGEKKLFGRGVEYSLTEVKDFAGLRVAIIGGGASAVQSAIAFSEYAAGVVVIHRRDSFSAEATDIKKLTEKKNVDIFFSSIAVEIIGKTSVEALVIQNCTTDKQRSMSADRVVIMVGLELNLSFLGSLVARDEKGYISITSQNETSCPGIFAAGDATILPFHQVVVSAGEGAKAALSAYRFLQAQRGARSIFMDWEHR